ncbi:Coiled-coil domain-containing protein 39 [Hondaea fermentalgiana]|uniref:Coiled-coil domain-containing protein 39 n=1 Tax=Hondaea fermentalgiana TaxID=2315210 RepID=A0A2R5G0X7_9STRA|nr:Coiled-coil domain-containing protein 39 [Hondaea fermentalgiana]|eukprot:GBG24660.1 Coiled-coil domain-containing protein 39 [Hondaea fermentalgiana]
MDIPVYEVADDEHEDDKKDRLEAGANEDEVEEEKELDNTSVNDNGATRWVGASDEGYDNVENLDQDEDEDDDDMALDGGVPLFANRENRELHKHISQLELELEKAQEKLLEHEERKRAMAEHVKSVQQEFRHTQQLLEAKRKELDTEKHMEQMSKREAGRVKLEIAKTDTAKEDLQTQLSAVQNEIFKGNDLMDKFKVSMNFNQEELEQWTLAMTQNEDDKNAFERYMKSDDAKTKELNFTIEKLTVELQEKRKLLDEEVTETQAKQIELDKTAEEFRARHRERQDVIHQWQNAIAQVKARDEDIQKAGENFAISKSDLRHAKKDLGAEKARLEALEADCQEMETQSQLVDRILQKKRAEEVEVKERVENFRAEVELRKTEVAKASNEVQIARQKVVNAKLGIEEAQTKLDGARERLQVAKQALEEARNDTSTAELSASAAEEALHAREAEVKAVEQALAHLKDVTFRESEALFQSRQREANLLAEISGAQATGKNLSHEIQRLDEESLRQKELVYTAEFQIQQLERRVARAKGIRSDDEKKVLNKRIAECKQELEAAQSQNGMLLSQVKNLEDELRSTKRAAVSAKEQRKELSARLHELKLENGSAENSLQGIMKQKEDAMVNHDLMKLQVKSLRDQLNERADKVYGLENRKFQLEMSMQERKKEIQVHSDMQRARAKLAEEERHKIAMEAKDCKLRVQKLEKKFATIAKSPEVGEDGEERSQAYFVIAAAQRREELQREGDELDAEIRKATREIRALEETLADINAINSKSRTAAHRANPKSHDAMELRRVVRETEAARDTAFKKKKELQRLIADLAEDKRRIEQLHEQAKVASENSLHLDQTHEQVVAEVGQQQAQLDRANAKLREHRYQHRESLGLSRDKESVHETIFKNDLLNQTRDSVLYTLGQLTKEFPEMEDDLQLHLGRFGLNIPSAPPETPSMGFDVA